MLIKEFLAEFFSLAQAREPNLHIAFRLPGKPDECARQVHNLYLLAHVQDKNVTVLSNYKGLQDQRHSLACCHEEALDFRVCDRQRLMVSKLLSQYWHHASV